MSKGTIALIGALSIVALVVISFVSLLVWLFNASPDHGFLEIMWMSLMRTLDAGTLGGDDGTIWYLFFMFIITLAGIFIVSILIGLLTSGIENKLDSLRKGKSLVIEKNHTIIFGWSDMIFSIISELIEANKNQKNPCIVILGDKDKVEMEDEIRIRIPDLGKVNIVCRQGNPIDINDISIVSPQTAKSIIIIDDNDANVIKTILAILNSSRNPERPYHIVTRLMDSQNLEIGKIVGKDQVEYVLMEDFISRMVVQTCLHPGLSEVFVELLDFGGDEIYFHEDQALIGKQFGEVQLMYDRSLVIGLLTQGKVKINPPADTIIQQTDQIIAISEDDDTIVRSRQAYPQIDSSLLKEESSAGTSQVKVLILGWNKKAVSIVKEMDAFVRQGSSITAVAQAPGFKKEIEENCQGLTNITVECLEADINQRSVLDDLCARNYDRIIILAYDNIDIQEADAITLVALLHLRDIAESRNIKYSIVSEILDIRNRNLAEVAKVNDFIVSDKLVSLLLTQIAENKHLAAVFKELFDADGSEIYTKSVTNYIQPGTPVNFYTITQAAINKGEVAIGYKIAGEEGLADKKHGIYINPDKKELVHFTAEDSIIVIAES